MRNKRIITILMIFTIIFTLMGGTLAYWSWQSTTAQQTNVAFTVKSNFSCAADIGGNVSSTEANLIPTSDCTSADYAIQRTVTVKPTLSANASDDLSIAMDLWLEVESITSGITNSGNFRYALTTSPNSCTQGVVSRGSFYGREVGDTLTLLQRSYRATTTETYYLYIWLDAGETDSATMNQTFELSVNGNCSETIYTEPAEPVLDQGGMIPVTIANDGTATTILASDENWYDYLNQEWANVVLVTDDTREKYLGTTGVSVDSDDVLAQYVWIPRYKYKMPSISCSEIDEPTIENNPSCYGLPYTMSDEDKSEVIAWFQSIGATEEEATSILENGLTTGTIQFDGEILTIPEFISLYNINIGGSLEYSGTFNENNREVVPVAGDIDIVFEEGNAEMSMGDALSTYRTHPAFWWDDDSNGSVDSGETIAGIWVGKFETTGTVNKPTILPNIRSLSEHNVSTTFSTSLKFSESGNIYGLSDTSTNSHMMKNSERGAVLYLSHSQYGINGEIRASYYDQTGSGVLLEDENPDFINTNDIFRTNKVSTLELKQNQNNVSTIVAAPMIWYGKASKYPQSTTANISGVFAMSLYNAAEAIMANFNDSIGSSGFDAMPDSKYYDLYTSTDINTACNGGICYGHALSETSSWYSNTTVSFITKNKPWLLRGATNAFAFNYYNGLYDESYVTTFRSVIIVGFGA